MATNNTSTSNQQRQQQQQHQQPTEFELRRTELVGQIGDSLEQVLTQINALNRQLESIIEIGNEFASVEALWSQFESVMDSQKVEQQQQQQQQHDTDGPSGADVGTTDQRER